METHKSSRTKIRTVVSCTLPHKLIEEDSDGSGNKESNQSIFEYRSTGGVLRMLHDSFGFPASCIKMDGLYKEKMIGHLERDVFPRLQMLI